MKRLFFAALSVLFLSSCSSTFFFATLQSYDKENVMQVENGDFLIEKDSLWIAYCFNGESVPIQITVFNKSKTPLYIDWQKSALILDDLAYNYAGEQISMEGGFSGMTSMDNRPGIFTRDGVYMGNFSGSASLPKYISFIPPNSMVTHKPIRLSHLNFEGISKKAYGNSFLQDKEDATVKVKRIDFTPDNAPLKFKSYLTLYRQPDRPEIFEHEFYLSNLIKTDALSPNKLSPDLAKRGDLFYIEKPANTSFAEGLLGATVLVGVVALDVTLNKNQYQNQ